MLLYNLSVDTYKVFKRIYNRKQIYPCDKKQSESTLIGDAMEYKESIIQIP